MLLKNRPDIWKRQLVLVLVKTRIAQAAKKDDRFHRRNLNLFTSSTRTIRNEKHRYKYRRFQCFPGHRYHFAISSSSSLVLSFFNEEKHVSTHFIIDFVQFDRFRSRTTMK